MPQASRNFLDLHDLVFWHAMSDVMESGLLSLEGYVNPVSRFVFDVGAQAHGEKRD